MVRGPRNIWIGGVARAFVPLAALSAIYVGTRYYYPDGYVALAAPQCSGVTPDGCTLQWQEVPLVDGGSEFQCVQYCPRPETVGAAPPPAVVAPPPAPAAEPAALPPAACEMTIFAEPNFSGVSTPVTSDQPELSEAGWKNEIASLQIKSGTWDFYSDENYGGEVMRMTPGNYSDLGAQWTKRIGSFMCVKP